MNNEKVTDDSHYLPITKSEPDYNLAINEIPELKSNLITLYIDLSNLAVNSAARLS